MASCLKINFEDIIEHNSDSSEYRNKPFANSPVQKAYIKDYELLTKGQDVKTVYKLTLGLETSEFLPGDTIAILPENDEKEVEQLLRHLNLTELRFNKYHLKLNNNANGKVTIPKHIPESSTLYNVFLRHIDIRSVPKKKFLKALLKYTEDALEIEKLEFMSSPSGSQEYIAYINSNPTLLLLLKYFPSCKPPIELILEHSAPLNPRYFSIASSPLTGVISIVFNVLELGNGLKGVCTGWLENVIKEKKAKHIFVYFRKPGKFRLDTNKPNKILIATGTGVAPFLSYLEHLKCSDLPSKQETWLFYGCRYSSRDFLCKNQILSCLDQGVITKLFTAFSREDNQKHYVQHEILKHQKEVVDMIFNKQAQVLVCGDAKQVVKAVKEALLKCIEDYNNNNRTSAEEIFSDLVKNDRFLVDTWA